MQNLENGERNIVKREALIVKVVELLKKEDGADYLDMAFDRWQRYLVQANTRARFMFWAFLISYSITSWKLIVYFSLIVGWGNF